ncbi:MAG: hypothetical protein HC906_00340 [Bacteroidales bacterium]|nr:hypothetical protein [Bacteroidales bacterium]
MKLSLSDSYLGNMGPDKRTNPLLAALVQSPLMAPNVRDPETGQTLVELEDVGVFNSSNPVAIIQEGIGDNRNYHFLSSVDAQYKISKNFTISTLNGLDFNNSREGLFIPDVGLVGDEFADNTRSDLVYEFRSFQDHSKLEYLNALPNGNVINAIIGMHYMKNDYKFDEGNDLNTPSDDFRNLGQGAKYQYLRTTLGDNRELKWLAFYGKVNYSIKDKYYFNGSVTQDYNSNVTSKTRGNLYPYVGAAWRISSENAFSSMQSIADMKLRASYGITGNMYGLAYDYSKLFYIGKRWNTYGVVVRDAIPNEDMEIEKKSTISAGLDVSLFNQKTNIHFDYYRSMVGNLLLNQQLPAEYGFTNYYNNEGRLSINGYELAFDSRIQGQGYAITYGASVSRYETNVDELNFIDPEKQL